MDFIVLGLPRSATTWVANWLTTDHSLCLHDPFATQLPEEWPRDDRRFGISCTGAYLFPRWLAQAECPVAIIERDHEACAASLTKLGMDGHRAMATVLAGTAGRRWQFDDLWSERHARDLWEFLLPGVAFDALRYRLLKDMQVQPHMGKWRFDPSVIDEMKRREAGG